MANAKTIKKKRLQRLKYLINKEMLNDLDPMEKRELEDLRKGKI